MPDTLPIDSVTVHPDGAVVTRRGALPAQGGVIRVRALPLLLDADSLRVERADGPLGAVRLELDLAGLDATAEPEEAAALARAEHRVQALRARLAHLSAVRETVDRLSPAGPAKDDRSPPPVERLAQWSSARGALDAWLGELDEQRAAAQRTLLEAEQALALAQDRMRSVSSEALMRRWLPTRVAVIGVDAEGPVPLSLSYRVPGALWSPCYTLRTDGAFTQGRFAVRALVAQATGEDWGGVRLALSTTPSARAVDLPELPALRLGTRQPPRRSGWRPLPADLDTLFPGELPTVPEALDPEPDAGPPGPDLDESDALDELRVGALAPDDDTSADGEALEGAAAVPWYSPPGNAPPPPQAVMASMPPMPPPAAAMPPLGAAAPLRSRAATPFGGGGPPADLARGGPPPRAKKLRAPEPAPEPEPELATDALDYERLRLAPPSAPAGRRGRLLRHNLTDEVRAAGAPAGAVQRLRELLQALQRAVTQVHRVTLPPHHSHVAAVDGVDFCYDTQGRVDVPADGQPRALAVFASPADVELRYRAVPREDPRVYRRARVAVRDRGTPFLSGPVDLYVDDVLTLTLPWGGSSGGGELNLDLGPEDGLKVARNVRTTEEAAGLLRGSRRLITEIEVQVASSLTRPVRVELLERVPVAGDDQVTVEQTHADPEAQPWTGTPTQVLKGGRRQVLALAPGALGRATLRYTMTMANHLELQGGDRRG